MYTGYIMRIIRVLPFILFFVSLYCCEPLIKVSDLPGDISGIVTDSETSEPIPQVHIKLNLTNDSTLTGDDGSYLINNIKEGHYNIQASKPRYIRTVKDVSVDQVTTSTIDFSLDGAAEHHFSCKYLDFGIDSTVKRFTISNIGKGTLIYSLLPSEGWLDIEPSGGQVSTGMDTIEVTIDTTAMNGQKQEESITISYYVGDDLHKGEIGVYVNGVMGPLEKKYYHVVRIGTQVWMAESLNAGIQINWSLTSETSDDEIFEKYCYANNEDNCDFYGGMYSWDEMMDYNSPENDPLIMIQGICPEGWHIPDRNEWLSLAAYAGTLSYAGGHLKDTGTIENGTGFWRAPNEGATNKYGFTALPGGLPNGVIDDLCCIEEGVQFHVASQRFYYAGIHYDRTALELNKDEERYNPVNYVRWLKDE